MSSSDSASSVLESETPNTRVITFAVDVSSLDLLQINKDEFETLKASSHGSSALFHDQGVVGTILLMNKQSAFIWLGWGQVTKSPDGTESSTSRTSTGKSINSRMGSLVAAMPRTKYQGAFSGDCEASTTKLIGSEQEEMDTLGRNMASRLSSKLCISVLLSCHLDGIPASEGLDSGLVQHRVAALAERKIHQLLKNSP
jgi:hypothetical protein